MGRDRPQLVGGGRAIDVELREQLLHAPHVLGVVGDHQRAARGVHRDVAFLRLELGQHLGEVLRPRVRGAQEPQHEPRALPGEPDLFEPRVEVRG